MHFGAQSLMVTDLLPLLNFFCAFTKTHFLNNIVPFPKYFR